MIKIYIAKIELSSEKQFTTKEARELYIKAKRKNHNDFCKRSKTTDYKFKVKRSTSSRKYANLRMYTDIKPYEITKVISDKTIEIRRMDSTHTNKADLKFQSGGFSAHCVNNWNQQYTFKSNKDYEVVRARLRADGYFYSMWGRHSLDKKPSEHYDYNF